MTDLGESHAVSNGKADDHSIPINIKAGLSYGSIQSVTDGRWDLSVLENNTFDGKGSSDIHNNLLENSNLTPNNPCRSL